VFLNDILKNVLAQGTPEDCQGHPVRGVADSRPPAWKPLP